jgi:tRNA pseudouridine55 synthase
VTDGLLVVDKPAGMTSHDVVARIRRIYRMQRVGHAGTLDPDATGVLLVGLGRVTRLLRFVQEASKTYTGRIAFGIATSTLDASGEETARQPMPGLTGAAVSAAAATFVGDIEQVPPMVSAVKVDGQRLHALARQGIEVERTARPVTVHRFEVTAFEPGDGPDGPGFPAAEVVVDCSSGTYVRVLAADLGVALGGVAHLARLRRTRIGPFAEREAHGLDAIAADPEGCVLAPIDAVRGLAQVRVADDLAAAVRHGRRLPDADTGAPRLVAVLDAAGELLAVYEIGEGQARPLVVLAGA